MYDFVISFCRGGKASGHARRRQAQLESGYFGEQLSRLAAGGRQLEDTQLHQPLPHVNALGTTRRRGSLPALGRMRNRCAAEPASIKYRYAVVAVPDPAAGPARPVSWRLAHCRLSPATKRELALSAPSLSKKCGAFPTRGSARATLYCWTIRRGHLGAIATETRVRFKCYT